MAKLGSLDLQFVKCQAEEVLVLTHRARLPLPAASLLSDQVDALLNDGWTGVWRPSSMFPSQAQAKRAAILAMQILGAIIFFCNQKGP